MDEDLQKTISMICKKTGKTEEQINGLLKAKIEKFSGLLTTQGAIFMIQKELGIANENLTQVKINELKDGMKDIEIKGTIKTIYPTKEFEKNGKTGKIGSFLLEDETGLLRITLWNDQIDKYDLTIGSEIKINNGFVTSYNEKKQVSLGYNGDIEILNKKEEVFEKISELKGGINSANIIGRLIRKFPPKEFESNERKGKLCSFQFGDETALLRATAWNEKADELLKFNEGDTIEIKNAYTKNGMFGVELHLGYSAILNKSEKDFPSVTTILKDTIVKKEINQINENENVIIQGKISEVQKGNVYFNACEKCGKKIDGKICEKCGEVKIIKKAVLSAIIEDDTATLRANFFGNNALKLVNWSEEDLEKETSEKSNEKIILELNEKLKDTPIKLFGYSKINSFSGENEFSVKEIV